MSESWQIFIVSSLLSLGGGGLAAYVYIRIALAEDRKDIKNMKEEITLLRARWHDLMHDIQMMVAGWYEKFLERKDK